MTEPHILSRSEHPVSRSAISPNALKVLYRLKDCGYQSFLVGGCVRDLMLGHQPKDFDVATDATPEQIKKAFRNCRLIGRRFRLAHIHFGREYIEVATFRAATDDDEIDRQIENKRVVSDNVYGSIEEDAQRRDFSINALYYNIVDFTVRDYVGGIEDIRAGLIRLIGDPERRYLEDPVRMLRAVRFAAKLGLSIAEDSASPIPQMTQTLSHVPPARLFDEVLKLLLSGHAAASFEGLRRHELFSALFPETAEVLARPGDRPYLEMLEKAMRNTDERIAEAKPVTPAFLFATLLWPALDRHISDLSKEHPLHDAIHLGAEQVLFRQLTRTSIPRRFSVPMREIWQLQPRFDHRTGKRATRLLHHPRFRAAYDFLLLRAICEPDLAESVDFWTQLQEMDEQDKSRTLHGQPRKRGRRSRGGRRPRQATEN